MNRTYLGVALALATALISGVAIYVNAFAVKQLPDAAVFTTLKNGLAAGLLLVPALAAARGRRPTRAIDRRAAAGVAFVGIFGGGVAFLLFFTGLALASAPSAAFIHKTLFVWVALLAVPLLRERLGLLQVGALGVLLAAQLLITPPTGVTWGMGETLIAGATLIWSLEVIVARRLMASVPAAALGAGRLGIGLVVLVGYLAVTGRLPVIALLDAGQWSWVIITGVLLGGYVATWFAALSRAPAVVVTSILVVGAPITATLTAISSGALPALPQLAGYVLVIGAGAVVAGMCLLAARRARTRLVGAVG